MIPSKSIRLACIALIALLASSGLSAKELSFNKDLPVVIDTQVTETDETPALSTPSLDNPIYYNLVVLGFHEFGGAVHGETVPDREDFIAQVVSALATRGYLAADTEFPATKTIGLTWGSLLEEPAASERYLSGQQHAINWQTRPVIAQNRDYRPSFDWKGLDRTTYGRVLNVRRNDTYIAFLTLCDWDAQAKKETHIDWQTRVMIRERGISAAKALPKAVDAMVAAFGHHSEVPDVVIVSRNAETTLASTPDRPSPIIVHDYSKSE